MATTRLVFEVEAEGPEAVRAAGQLKDNFESTQVQAVAKTFVKFDAAKFTLKEMTIEK